MRMTALLVASILLLLALPMLHGKHPQGVLAQVKQKPINRALLPPVGNSEALASQCRKAFRTYRCVQRKWQLRSSFAHLVSSRNASVAVGNYTFTYNGTGVSEWYLFNSREEQTESGFECTVLCGKVLITSGGDQLLEISSRNMQGLYSYIRTSSIGGLPPQRACRGRDAAKVSFASCHTFYTQDRVPPSTGALALSSRDRPVESLFSSGAFRWVRGAGRKWVFGGGRGILWDCPGGTPVGFITVRPNYVITWSVQGPYGWAVTGSRTRSVTKASQDWPWQLYTVTGTQGSQLLGRRTYVHLISTRGGMPPLQSNASSGTPLSARFSAISWFYTTTWASGVTSPV